MTQKIQIKNYSRNCNPLCNVSLDNEVQNKIKMKRFNLNRIKVNCVYTLVGLFCSTTNKMNDLFARAWCVTLAMTILLLALSERRKQLFFDTLGKLLRMQKE